MDVVLANVPMLIGLEILDRENLILDITANDLISKSGNRSIPTIRKDGHLYVEWEIVKTLYTRNELKKLHLHFYHPSSDKLYQLLRQANPENTTTDLKALIEDINRACTTCERLTPNPHAFQVAVPSGITFNEKVVLDIMYLEQSSALHVVDTQTHFNSAVFLGGVSVEMVWIAFL
jgi:hypothetical protein